MITVHITLLNSKELSIVDPFGLSIYEEINKQIQIQTFKWS